MSSNTFPNIVLLSDFDGTITDPDILRLVFTKFAQGDWEKVNFEYLSGKLTLEECLQQQYAMIPTSKEEMLQWIRPRLHARAYFKQLVQFCHDNHIPFLIVSSGLDFIINEFCNTFALGTIPFIATQTDFADNIMKIRFAPRQTPIARDFKEDTVCYYKSLGKKIYYLGDGISDISAVQYADVSFVVKDSRLATICQEKHIKYTEFRDFHEIITFLIQELEFSHTNP